jgi:oxygen-dependent protoporphyrinogen oxidase
MRVGIVGAGITGLSLVHHLAQRDVDCVAFEAAAEPGGVMRSQAYANTVLEHGPQRLRLTNGVQDLVDYLGLDDQIVTADDELPLYVYANGDLRRVPRSLTAFFGTDLLTWRGKVDVLREPLTDPIDPAETAREAFVRKFGEEAYRNLVGPLFGGTYSSDPAEMPAEHALTPLMRLEKKHGSLLAAALDRMRSSGDTPPPVTFEDGNQILAEALYEEYAPAVHLDSPVETVREDGDGYELVADGGAVAVDEVVVTAPAGATAGILDEIAPEAADRMRGLTYNSLAYVFLESAVECDGLGYQVRHDDPIHTLGVTWNGSAFDRDGLFTVFMGGMTDQEVLERSDEELGEIAVAEFATVMDADAEVLTVNRLPDVIPAYDHSWERLDDLELPNGITLATNYTARLGVPSRIREAKKLATEFAQAEDAERADVAPVES